MAEDDNLPELRAAIEELKSAVSFVRNQRGTWEMPPSIPLPSESSGWNFTTFEKYINQRFGDLSQQLNERAQSAQLGITAALAAAEKAVTAALCLEANTPILCADLTWRPAGELRIGDELIALDDENSGTSRGRQFRRSVVEANALKQDQLLEVETSCAVVRCNADHPWLARNKHEHRWDWTRASDLRPGLEVLQAVDVWEVDQSWEAGWLAGMFDGEGCLCFKNGTNGKARLSIVQRESETANRMEAAIASRIRSLNVQHRPQEGTWQPRMECSVDARPDIMKLLGSIRPPRLLANADAVWEGFAVTNNNRAVAVISVKPAGLGTVASLSTSTGTYIGAGFCMHNTAAEKAVDKAEAAQQLRNEAQNEFRQALADLSKLMWMRIEGEAALESLRRELSVILLNSQDRLRTLENGYANLQGRIWAVSALFAIVAMAIDLTVRFVSH